MSADHMIVLQQLDVGIDAAAQRRFMYTIQRQFNLIEIWISRS